MLFKIKFGVDVSSMAHSLSETPVSDVRKVRIRRRNCGLNRCGVELE